MTIRTLARGSAIYAAGNLLARLGGFILLPIYLQLMSRDEYGIVALATSITGLLTILYRLGLDGALMRMHFDTPDSQRPALYRTITLATLAIAGVLSISLGFAVGPFFDVLFFGIPFLPYGVLALAITFVGSVDFIPSVLFRATQQPEKFLVFNLASFGVASAFSLVLVAGGMGALGVLLGQLLGGLVILVVVMLIAFNPGGASWRPAVLPGALRFGVPLVPHQVSTWALRLSDRWLIGLLLAVPVVDRLGAIAAYSVGYQLGFLVAIVATSFNAAWTPYFYRVGDLPGGAAVYRAMLTISSAAFLWMALAMAAVAPELIRLIAGDRQAYAVAADVVPVIAFACAAQGTYTMLVGPIFLRRRTGFLPLMTVSSAVANVGLNIVLVPRIGVIGAAWATLGAYALFALLTYLYARRVYPTRVDFLRLAVYVAITLAGVAVARMLDRPGIVTPFLFHAPVILAAGALLTLVVLEPLGRLRRAMAEVRRAEAGEGGEAGAGI
jgi:O-antigen/teichoic acid export membrane protein